MKQNLPLRITFIFAALAFVACSRKSYTYSYFDQQTAHHRIIAVLPAEMIFTGTKPKNLDDSTIAKIEETESVMFQNYLFNGILQHANTNRYYTSIAIQDISTTQKLLEDSNISVRDSWRQDDKKLAKLLGVDAVVRLRIQKKRYMSDEASMGIDYGRQVLGAVLKRNVYAPSKTNDIIASCSIVSKGETVWNDNYRRAADWDTPADYVVNNITENFANHIPYRQRQ